MFSILNFSVKFMRWSLQIHLSRGGKTDLKYCTLKSTPFGTFCIVTKLHNRFRESNLSQIFQPKNSQYWAKHKCSLILIFIRLIHTNQYHLHNHMAFCSICYIRSCCLPLKYLRKLIQLMVTHFMFDYDNQC